MPTPGFNVVDPQADQGPSLIDNLWVRCGREQASCNYRQVMFSGACNNIYGNSADASSTLLGPNGTAYGWP